LTRRTNPTDPAILREELIGLLQDFKKELNGADLRKKVLKLVPAVHKLRDLGLSLITKSQAASARDRILFYLKKYPRMVISGDELFVVSGIGEWARRVRELRVESGWSIITGTTAKEMQAEDEFPLPAVDVAAMKPDDYILLKEDLDKESAYRWNLANEIRGGEGSIRDKIILFLRNNVGKEVTGEELRYVAGDKTEWARRVRELRTEFGWPVVTKSTGQPDLPVGVYVLEMDRQSPVHDRKIPDAVRMTVLERDKYKCVSCGWHQGKWNKSDPRHLELHHKKHHAKGGTNTADNLDTLCTKCHDDIHRKEKS
jgi:hypothetical protein